jgi:hypothetical protein
MGLDGAAVELNQAPHKRQTQPQAADGILTRRLNTRKDVEDAGQRLWREADPIIGDREDCIVALLTESDANASMLGGIFGGVIEKV